MESGIEDRDAVSHLRQRCRQPLRAKIQAAIGGKDAGGHWGQRFRQMWRTELQAPRERESSLGTGSAFW